MATTHFSGPIALGTASVKTNAATVTLTEADNGQVYLVSGGAATITLPTAKAGLRFKFITAGSITGNIVITADPADSMEGSMIVAGVVVDVNAADVVTFVNTADNLGDFVEVISNGSDWFVFGNALTSGALTATG